MSCHLLHYAAAFRIQTIAASTADFANHDNPQSLFSATGVIQVNIPAATGDMGILANHVPTVEALRPGVVEVIEEGGTTGKKWFGTWDKSC
jgi:hypothetical protein